jgi:hypothetical protein
MCFYAFYAFGKSLFHDHNPNLASLTLRRGQGGGVDICRRLKIKPRANVLFAHFAKLKTYARVPIVPK